MWFIFHFSFFKLRSDLPHSLFTFAAQTDLFTQAGFQQKLAKKKTLMWLSLSDKCVF